MRTYKKKEKKKYDSNVQTGAGGGTFIIVETPRLLLSWQLKLPGKSHLKREEILLFNLFPISITYKPVVNNPKHSSSN